MTVAASQIKLTGTDRSIYLLRWGEYADKETSGPFIGATGLDFSALAIKYRLDRYAAAEAACKDFCYVDEGDFTLMAVEQRYARVYRDNRRLYRYPSVYRRCVRAEALAECPECGNGRGEPEYGEVRKA